MMRDFRPKRRIWPFVLATAVGLFGLLATEAGRFLVVDEPRPSDLILVLAGETEKRPERALQLLANGYGRRMVIDVPAETSIFGFSEVQLASRYVQNLPQSTAVRICPIEGLSTRDEALELKNCLAEEKSDSVLIVTSDFHTRRALSILRRELPGKTFSIAAAYDNEQFGTHYWAHRQWAKTCLEEWLRVVWWNAVDRWR